MTASVAARVQSVLDMAEREASELQREVEASSEQRATELLLSAEREAEQLVQSAGEAVVAYLDDARERIDAYVAERVRRIHDATERLLLASEQISGRLDEAGETRRAITTLIEALGQAAREAAGEGAAALPEPPPAPGVPRSSATPPGADA